ncbi:MAG: hypothetical protein M3176_09455 [Chloroflexota bacterium]|nr:hypothetical protein [Chloroflexota bacterium]MDQ6907042.1 hypothetical protein [Chloroflexota bacterium]
MSARRMVAIFVLAIVIIAMMILIWYIGSQKTVATFVAPYQLWEQQ